MTKRVTPETSSKRTFMVGAHDPGSYLAGKDDSTAILIALRADFSAFRIWREIIPGRARYIARRLHPGPGPHTVVTDDLTELRTALCNAATLGGQGHHPADHQTNWAARNLTPEEIPDAIEHDYPGWEVHYTAGQWTASATTSSAPVTWPHSRRTTRRRSSGHG
jgi:hypothetical protein